MAHCSEPNDQHISYPFLLDLGNLRYYLAQQISLFNFDPTSLVILSFHQVESPNGEDDLAMVVINVDRRCMTEIGLGFART